MNITQLIAFTSLIVGALYKIYKEFSNLNEKIDLDRKEQNEINQSMLSALSRIHEEQKWQNDAIKELKEKDGKNN